VARTSACESKSETIASSGCQRAYPFRCLHSKTAVLEPVPGSASVGGGNGRYTLMRKISGSIPPVIRGRQTGWQPVRTADSSFSHKPHGREVAGQRTRVAQLKTSAEIRSSITFAPSARLQRTMAPEGRFRCAPLGVDDGESPAAAMDHKGSIAVKRAFLV